MNFRILTFLLFFLTSSVLAQETTKPMHNTEIMRDVKSIDIEGKEYNNVKVTFKSISPDYFISDSYRVKVRIVDANNKTVWKKTLKNVFLYVFSSGQIQVGKPNFDKIVISKSYGGEYTGKIREKEGIY
ncbi:hypothetical protein [Sphingobacterium mizutaii]|uniref:hypothetical protein n=1 Tax=Sphingobacterium mizutaii TaxID=1010 RepID=UPI00162911A8|nr:hypothetical protein [Sphingobacterium mizutaii]